MSTTLQAPYSITSVESDASPLAEPVEVAQIRASRSALLARGLTLVPKVASGEALQIQRLQLNGRSIELEAHPVDGRPEEVRLVMRVDRVQCTANRETPQALCHLALEVLDLDDFARP